MHTYLIDMLECPACHGELDLSIVHRSEQRIDAAEATCKTCAAVYPVRDGIGLFLTPDLPRNDLWEQIDSGLIRYLRQQPELERQLLETPLASLNAADQFFRALVLEARGNYAEARTVEDAAWKTLYTPEYIDCWNRQLDYVIEQLSTSKGPIVDLVSGRGYLVEKLASELNRPIVATDFSPSILRRNRHRLESAGRYVPISLLALDARRTPFKTGSIEDLTTNLGLPNIEGPGGLLRELRRIAAGVFLAISHFYPEEDEANARAIRATGSDRLLYRRTTLQQYIEAGWIVEVKNACIGQARSTPRSVVLDGAGIDGLPVADTSLEWCVLLGTINTAHSKHEKVSL